MIHILLGHYDMNNLWLILVSGIWSIGFLQGCSSLEKEERYDERLTKFDRVFKSVGELYEIWQIVKSGENDAWDLEQRVIVALQLGGSKKEYFAMQDFVKILSDYEARYGRDRYFNGAARLAYCYSDGEYAGIFDARFPDLVDIYRRAGVSPE